LSFLGRIVSSTSVSTIFIRIPLLFFVLWTLS